MKFSTGIIALLFSTVLFAKVPPKHTIDESFWINETKPEVFELLKSRPELTIDHVKANGFELYGPKGLELFLQQNLIEYRKLESANQSFRSEYPTPESVVVILTVMPL